MWTILMNITVAKMEEALEVHTKNFVATSQGVECWEQNKYSVIVSVAGSTALIFMFVF